MFGERRRRREQELVEKDRWRVARKLMDEDVTVLGEQVAQLHVDTFTAVEQVVADARYHRAAVICLRDGEPLPERREPCFFNPQHGPSMQAVQWAPPSGTARTIGVCAADARALAAGDEPLVRMVRVGDRWVPWHLSGGMEGAIDAGAQVAKTRHGTHSQQGLAQAYLNQTSGGANGAQGHYGG